MLGNKKSFFGRFFLGGAAEKLQKKKNPKKKTKKSQNICKRHTKREFYFWDFDIHQKKRSELLSANVYGRSELAFSFYLERIVIVHRKKEKEGKGRRESGMFLDLGKKC